MIRNDFLCPNCAFAWTTDCTVQAIEPCMHCGLMIVGMLKRTGLHDAHVLAWEADQHAAMISWPPDPKRAFSFDDDTFDWASIDLPH